MNSTDSVIESEPESSTFSSRRASLVCICVVFLAAISLRLVDIGRSLWLDELHTSWVVSGSFADVWQRAVSGNQSPFYFWINWLVVAGCGQTELTLRIISVVAGSLLPVCVWWILSKRTSRLLIPIFGALLVAIDPHFIRYAQEARPYALLQLIGILQIGFFAEKFRKIYVQELASDEVRRQNRDESRHVGEHLALTQLINWPFVVTAVACFYLHYTAALLTVAFFVCYIGSVLFSGKKFTKHSLLGLLDFVLIGACCAVMLLPILEIAGRKSNWELFVNDNQLDPTIQFQLISYIAGPLLVWVLFGFRNWFRIRVDESSQTTFDKSILSLTFLVGYIGPIWLAWIALKTDLAPVYLSRYFLIGWPGAILFFGGSLIVFSRHFKPVIANVCVWVLLLFAFGSSVWQNDLLWHCIDQRKIEISFESPWRDAIKFLNDEETDGGDQDADTDKPKTNAIVYLFPNLIEDQFLIDAMELETKSKTQLEEYCLFPLNGIYRLRLENQVPKATLLPHRFNHADARRMCKAETVWMIIRGDQRIVSDILTEFSLLQDKENVRIEPIGKREFPVRGSPGNMIFVAKFRIGMSQ